MIGNVGYYIFLRKTPSDMLSKSAEGDESILYMCDVNNNTRSTWSESRSVVSDSLQPHGLYNPWTSLGQNTGVGSLSLLQGIFPIQESNPGLPHCR